MDEKDEGKGDQFVKGNECQAKFGLSPALDEEGGHWLLLKTARCKVLFAKVILAARQSG